MQRTVQKQLSSSYGVVYVVSLLCEQFRNVFKIQPLQVNVKYYIGTKSIVNIVALHASKELL